MTCVTQGGEDVHQYVAGPLILSPTETAQEIFPQYSSGARVNIRMSGSPEASSFPRLIILSVI